MMKKAINGVTIFEYAELSTAEALVELSVKPMQILMGDYPYYWVVATEDTGRLVELGYELLPRFPKVNQPSQHLPQGTHTETL